MADCVCVCVETSDNCQPLPLGPSSRGAFQLSTKKVLALVIDTKNYISLTVPLCVPTEARILDLPPRFFRRMLTCTDHLVVRS